MGGIVKDAKTNSLHEVVSKFNLRTYDSPLSLSTISACFIFLKLLIHRNRHNPELRNIELDWEKIELNDLAGSLIIMEGQLKSISEKIGSSSVICPSENLMQAIK